MSSSSASFSISVRLLVSLVLILSKQIVSVSSFATVSSSSAFYNYKNSRIEAETTTKTTIRNLDTALKSKVTDDNNTIKEDTTTTVKIVANSDDIVFNRGYEIESIPIRIGHGFDIHRMAPIDEAGQPIVIGGVTIPHKPLLWTDSTGKYTGTPNTKYETLLGVCAHSDGDVIYHSIVDAIFGALTLPDIGQIFQDTDPRWRGCDSSKFMIYAYDVMKQYGYQIGNLDVTLILERPKVANFKPAMKDNIVTLLQTTPGRVNIKARTHEQVDSVGELRSLSCHVVVTLEYVGKN